MPQAKLCALHTKEILDANGGVIFDAIRKYAEIQFDTGERSAILQTLRLSVQKGMRGFRFCRRQNCVLLHTKEILVANGGVRDGVPRSDRRELWGFSFDAIRTKRSDTASAEVVG